VPEQHSENAVTEIAATPHIICVKDNLGKSIINVYTNFYLITAKKECLKKLHIRMKVTGFRHTGW